MALLAISKWEKMLKACEEILLIKTFQLSIYMNVNEAHAHGSLKAYDD